MREKSERGSSRKAMREDAHGEDGASVGRTVPDGEVAAQHQRPSAQPRGIEAATAGRLHVVRVALLHIALLAALEVLLDLHAFDARAIERLAGIRSLFSLEFWGNVQLN